MSSSHVRTPEVNRILRQHDVRQSLLRDRWQGYFSAPVADVLRRGGKILDVYGQSDWLLDVAKEYPEAQCTGVNVLGDQFPETYPNNVTFCRVSILDKLPYEKGTFDFVHMQFLGTAFTEEQWETQVIDELVRIVKPEGWIEFMETDTLLHKPGVNCDKLSNALMQALSVRKINGHISDEIPRLLDSTGKIAEMQLLSKLMPFGRWAGPNGELASQDAINMYKSSRSFVVPYLNGVSAETYDQLVDAAFGPEAEQHRTCARAWRIWGRRIGPTSR